MPKSKRSVVVHLTATKRKPKSRRHALIERVSALASQADFAYIIRVKNPRVVLLQSARQQVPGKFVMGKARLMRKGLGEEAEAEIAPGLSNLARALRGGEALLFTDLAPGAVEKLLAQFRQAEFARAGAIAAETVELPEGILEDFAHTQEPTLRKLGLPTRLLDGKVHLMGRTTVCTRGEPLTVEAAQLVKMLGRQMAEFSLEIGAYWDRASGEVRKMTEKMT